MKRRMTSRLAAGGALAAALALLATPGAAQRRTNGPPKTSASAFLVWYPDPGTLTDPAIDGRAETRWDFGAGVGPGLALHRTLAPGFALGVEGTYASSIPVEITTTCPPDVTCAAVLATASGHARLASAMASARLETGGGGAVAFYFTGSAGFFFWGMPAPVSRWDHDLALRPAAGLQLALAPRSALFLEWGQLWAFHDHEGVKSNTHKFSQIRLGGRLGW